LTASQPSSVISNTPLWMSRISVALADDVQLTAEGEQRWTLTSAGRPIAFRVPPGKLSDLLHQLSREEVPLEWLVNMLDEPKHPLSVTEQVLRLWRAGCLKQTLRWNGQLIAVLKTCGETPLIAPATDCSARLTLTENACIRRSGSSLLIESLECGAGIELPSLEYCRVITALMKAATPASIAQQLCLEESVVTALVFWLNGIGAACTEQEQQRDHLGWSFADRLLHARSRLESHIGGYGATFPGRNKTLQHAPAVRPAGKGTRVPLSKPDLAAIIDRDRPFTSVLEARCSLRDYDQAPLAAAELGEFLYRVARIRSTSVVDNVEYAARPFPSAGRLHELEIYPLISSCDRIPPGLYRYDGLAHELELVSEPSPHTRRLMLDALLTAGTTSMPHVLILLAARFPRINWKYESIAYALILKNVGVVYQTMYLVATAMGLASCALGGGNSACFCRAAGTGYWDESSVGEFMLGRKNSLERPTTSLDEQGVVSQ
jgi:oxazoline/thiazoline dehydrogenase